MNCGIFFFFLLEQIFIWFKSDNELRHPRLFQYDSCIIKFRDKCNSENLKNAKNSKCKLTVVAHACNTSTWEADARELPQVPGQSKLHSKLKDSLLHSEILLQNKTMKPVNVILFFI